MTIETGGHRDGYCDSVPRRQALRIGGTGLMSGLSLPHLLDLQANAAGKQPRRVEACIMLFLEGGPSTIDMWDLKPEAPTEIRGPYKPIPTSVSGTFVGEHCGQCAKIAEKFTILRSHAHADNGHQTGYHYMMTGRRAVFGDGQGGGAPTNRLYPSMGSVISRELGRRSLVPVYVNLPNMMNAGGPGFYGAEYGPFVIENDPVQPDFQVKDLGLVRGVDSSRLELRKQLLAGVDQARRPASLGRSSEMSAYYEKAFDLITSPEAQKAFDIHSESEQVRERYGYTSLGQCALMSRRLVEAGCRFIGVDHGSWDTHFTCFPSLEKDLIPHADRAFSALITDLEQRGLLETTLVIMMGEMGRTPRINKQAGRDHWSQAQSVLFAGGGITPGKVVGATNKHAEHPITQPYGVEDLLQTVFYLMGIDSRKTHNTLLGRPVPILSKGQVIRELLS